MTEKELREIKRRFRPERSNIPRIVGCFVNSGSKSIIAKISQSLGMNDSVVNEKLLGVMKKTLSGSLGTNLTDVAYSTKQVAESEKHKLLMELLKSRLEDEGALDRFYNAVMESVELESNYVILLASDVYDSGIILIGGGAQLDGLPELIYKHLGIRATVAKNASDCVCRGIGWCLGNEAAKKYLKIKK